MLAAGGLASIENWLREREAIEDWVVSSLPLLIRESKSPDQHPYLSNLLSLNDDELSLLWAMVEVIDPSATLGVFADTAEIVRWAATRYPKLQDPLQALQRLQDLEMTGGSANEHLSLTAMVVPNALCLAAVVGEIERRFAARPLQRIASRTFDAILRLPLMLFSTAVISTSDFDLRAHRSAVTDIGQKDAPSRSVGDIPALAINFSLEGLPMSASVSFQSVANRDRGRESLRALDSGSRFEMRSVFEMPPKRVRWRRISDVLVELDNREKVDFTTSQQLLDLMDLRARAREVVRELTPLEEAQAIGLGDRYRYLLEVAEPPDSWIEYSISGAEEVGAERFRNAEIGRSLRRDPLRDLRLQAAGEMQAGEHIERWTARYSRDKEIEPPLRSIANETGQRGRAFNEGLPPVRFGVTDLELKISEELRTQALLHSGWLTLGATTIATGGKERPRRPAFVSRRRPRAADRHSSGVVVQGLPRRFEGRLCRQRCDADGHRCGRRCVELPDRLRLGGVADWDSPGRLRTGTGWGR